MAHVVQVSAFLVALPAVLGACNRGEAPHPGLAEEPASPAASAPETLAQASAFHDTAFSLVILPEGEYRAGEPSTAEIRLSPKGEYHTNDKYPYKWKAADSPGIRFAAPVLGSEAVERGPSLVTLKVPFTPESAGDKTVAGRFSFSVCSRERCLVEKRDLVLRIAAK